MSTEEKVEIAAAADEIDGGAESAAAKKRKKKKEKEKREKEEKRRAEGGGGPVDEPPKNNVAMEEAKNDADGDTPKSEAAKDKKAKKKKDKKEKEDKKEPKKKTNKAAEMIREMVRLREEAEKEAIRKAEEEEARQLAAIRAREEEERQLLAKKEEAQRKKAELIQKQKKEGTFLTKKQKAERDRARTLFESQGVVLPKPDGEEKPKKPFYGKKKTQKKPQISENETAQVFEGSTKVDKEKEAKIEEVDDEESENKNLTPEPEVLDDWEQIAVDDAKAKADKEREAKAEEAKETSIAKVTQQIHAMEEESEESSDSSDSDDESIQSEGVVSSVASKDKETKEMLFARVRDRLAKRKEVYEANKKPGNFRSPVICVLGHVDTGKTKMLDTIRRTNVQDCEAGGITQQIGATRVPDKALRERCKMVKDFNIDNLKIPGFLIIDTPGHESFANLRSRGSSLCDIAILVVDIMHGLEPQTIESLKLLIKRKTPFVIALNKVDRLYQYESNPRKDIYQHLKTQPINTQLEFKERLNKIIGEFSEQGINVALSTENNDFDDYISIVPTSAFCGDGIGNLMAHIVEQCQTRLAKKLIFSEELECIVMEVRSLPGLGTTIDVILINGTLKVNDAIVLTGLDGAIVTAVRDLLMPQPLREMRVKNDYEHYKEISGTQGVKILAKNLEKTVAGLPIYVIHAVDEIDVLREDAEEQLSKALMAIKKKPEGVYVQASTLGALEALLEFLRTEKIPYSNVNIGPVHKKDIQKAAAMLEHNPEFACILAFDVPVDREVQVLADREGVRIFQADIIYHLKDSFLKAREELRLKKRREHEHLAIFPTKLRVLPQHIFNARNPIVCGVSVEAGHLKKGTPISAKTKDGCVFLGNIGSIEKNHEQIDTAKAGDDICIKIDNTTGDAPKLYGRHFTHEDPLISRISRESIDVCKTYFREDLSKQDWQLIVQLKKWLNII